MPNIPKMLLAGCLAFGVMFGTGAQAATINADAVNCRAAARLSAFVLTVLKRGEPVTVLSRHAGWAYVDPAHAAACWIEARYLSGDAAATRSVMRSGLPRGMVSHSIFASRHAAVAPRKAGTARHLLGRPLRKAPRRHRATAKAWPGYGWRSQARSRSTPFYGGGSCSCGGRNICVGPRGGRYCITSGGNKRYGV